MGKGSGGGCAAARFNSVVNNIPPFIHPFNTQYIYIYIDIISKVESQTKSFLSTVRSLDRDERICQLKDIGQTFRECLKHGEEKVALAIQTYDMVGGGREGGTASTN